MGPGKGLFSAYTAATQEALAAAEEASTVQGNAAGCEVGVDPYNLYEQIQRWSQITAA